MQRLADRLAGYLVYFALGAAALTYLITRDVVSTISVVIVAGACGIAAGTPLAILGGIGRCARLGSPRLDAAQIRDDLPTLGFREMGKRRHAAPKGPVAENPEQGLRGRVVHFGLIQGRRFSPAFAP